MITLEKIKSHSLDKNEMDEKLAKLYNDMISKYSDKWWLKYLDQIVRKQVITPLIHT